MNKELKVSVVMITYNHEQFIEQAIESILRQEVNFDFELIISNDNSPDNLDFVVKNIIKNHPKGNKIKYINHSLNKGMTKNFVWSIEQCLGEFIALCEGDDFWLYNNKLQKQVDFLERNISFSFCCHRYKIYRQNIGEFDNKVYPLAFGPINDSLNGVVIDINLYAVNWITQPLTTVFRKEALRKYDLNSFRYFRDVQMYYLLLREGNGICFKDASAAYRLHEGGVHTGSSVLKRANDAIDVYTELFLVFRDVRLYENILSGYSKLLIKGKAFKRFFVFFICKLSFREKLLMFKFIVQYKKRPTSPIE